MFLLLAAFALAAPSVPTEALAPLAEDVRKGLDEQQAALAAKDEQIAKAAAEVEAMIVELNAPRRSPAQLAQLEVYKADAALDRADEAFVEKKKAIRVAKINGTTRAIQEAKDAFAAAKADRKAAKAELKEREKAHASAVKEGLPAPTQTPDEAAAERFRLEIAQRKLRVLQAERAVANAELEHARAQAVNANGGGVDLAVFAAEVDARKADLEKVSSELAQAEKIGPR